MASLWTALAAIVAYLVLGSSRILSSGPESTIALMTGVAIAPLAAQNPDRAVALSATLALIVAGWSLLARLLRAGIIAELLSTPLLVGYLAGGAVLMVVGQLGKLTGTSYEGGTIVGDVRGFLGVATDTDWLTLAVAVSTLAAILLLHWLRASLPGPLIAVVLATVASAVFNLESHGVAVVGQVLRGCPCRTCPSDSRTSRCFCSPGWVSRSSATATSCSSPGDSRWPRRGGDRGRPPAGPAGRTRSR